MIRRLRAPLAAALVATPLLLFLGGSLSLPTRPAAAEPPSALRKAFSKAVGELGRRAADFQSQRDVVRSLEGGGIAVNRLALFTAAGHALANAPPGAGLALTDPSGNVHAWWGDAPPLVGLEFSSGGIAVRWSATRLVVVQRKPVGDGGFSGLVYSSRSFPVEAPDFARALGVAGASAAWRPTAQGGSPLLTDSRTVLVAARRAPAPVEYPGSRDAAFGLALVICALLAGRMNDPFKIGIALALAFLAIETRFGGIDSLPPGTVAALSLGWIVLPFALPALAGRPISDRSRLAPLGGYLLLAAGLYAASGLETPELGAPLGESLLSLPRVGGLAALMLAALSLTASRRATESRGRTWITAALAFSAAAIVTSLAASVPSDWYRIAVFAAVTVALELWSVVHGLTSLVISKPMFAWPDVDALSDHLLTATCAGLQAAPAFVPPKRGRSRR